MTAEDCGDGARPTTGKRGRLQLNISERKDGARVCVHRRSGNPWGNAAPLLAENHLERQEMKQIPVRTGRRAMLSALSLTVLVLTLPALSARAAAQDQSAAASADQKPDAGAYQTFYLHHVTSFPDAEEIVTDLRNLLPRAKILYLPSQGAVSVGGSAADIQSAQKILSDVDRPRMTYRLTYSITEMDGNTTAGAQKVSLLVLDSGDKTSFKQGNKVPIITGSSAPGSSTQNDQVQYEDVGLSIDASVDGSPDLLRLNTKVVQSSVANEHAGGAPGDPSIRELVLQISATLVPGKPLVLGALDIPGTTHREEISVVGELVR